MKYPVFTLLFIPLLNSCHQSKDFRHYIDLKSTWQFALDTSDHGITQKWFAMDLGDSINLPGTTDLAARGFLNKDTSTGHLNRLYKYEGAAWYRKKIIIPDNFRDKSISLFLERTKSSMIWIDTFYVGKSSLLQSPQEFDVTSFLSPGEHFITIRIDNRLKLTPYGNVHIYSDDTQTNWNGIIGQIYLEAKNKTHISNLQLYPDIDSNKVNIRLEIENSLNWDKMKIELLVEKTVKGKTRKLKSIKMEKPCEPYLEFEYHLGSETALWDEYDQALYQLTAEISNGDLKDAKTVPFGMRKFSVKGTQFAINKRITFLRGKHDACVFPLTGHPPMDVEGWIKVFEIAKSYGINHYRFHSWCPPGAAFTAADQKGIYLQAELPFWGGLESDTTAGNLLVEGLAMLKSYANHPSFVMFSHGNEIWSGHDRVEKNIMALKKSDSRPLYTMGSNNNIGYVPPYACSDFFVGARTPYAHDTILTHTRLTHGYVDSKDGGILNTQVPSTYIRFSYPVNQMNIPVISHETGQYQIYPDFSEIEKYTGVLRAWNLEVFRNRLKKSGMMNQNIDFHKASGAWSAICYKAEMEAAIRTKGFAGFQLLDLQDFPGQGTALVGILDAFMDSKNVISREDWLQSCNDVVLLLEFPKFCWTNNEKFRAKIEVANYSQKTFKEDLEWQVSGKNGKIVSQGKFPEPSISPEGIRNVGEISFDFSSIAKAEKLTIHISLKNTPYTNSYPVWVYPQQNKLPDPGEIYVADALNPKVISILEEGGKVLLMPSSDMVKKNSLPGLFPPDFWNYGMFKGISEWAKKPVSPGTLGVLTDPKHPIFNSFPTEFHTHWQWFSIIKASNSLILDKTADHYRPVVQVIDNLERNHKLGLIFEFKSGKGKLLVCMSQLNTIFDKPEAVQLYQSILNYMNSGDFNPDYEVKPQELNKLIF